MAEIELKLATVSKIVPIEWNDVLESMTKKCLDALSEGKSTESAKSKIPSITEFTTTGILGKGGFGLVFKGVSPPTLDFFQYSQLENSRTRGAEARFVVLSQLIFFDSRRFCG